jgi:AcrR family transcriptional regulator
MAGVKSFDRDDVLDKAAGQFWRDGYEGSSIQSLEEATGLGRGSLYNAFGDKKALFLEVLARYSTTDGALPIDLLADADIHRGLHNMLHAIVVRMDQPDRPRGCLITNSCLSVQCPQVEQVIAAAMQKMQTALEAAFHRAQVEGQIMQSADIATLARFYTTVIRGLGVSHKAGETAKGLAAIVDVAVTAFPGNAASASA